MSDKYKISDEDIEVALRYLKLNESTDATREQAIALLEDLRSGFHGMAHHNPDPPALVSLIVPPPLDGALAPSVLCSS